MVITQRSRAGCHAVAHVALGRERVVAGFWRAGAGHGGSGRGRFGVALQDAGPAAGRGHAAVDPGRARAMPLEVAVLKLHAGLAVRLAGERDLDLAGVRGIGVEEPVVAVRVDLPGEHDPVRGIARRYRAPVALAAVHAALVITAADAGFEYGLGEVGGAEVVLARPPRVVTLGE